MENDNLTRIWKSQKNDSSQGEPEYIIKKAKKQRNSQYTAIVIMSITVLILLGYTAYFASGQWNDFSFGLVLMISSLTFRVILEFITLYRKENQLIALDNKAFQAYLKKHYRLRLMINYIITPICFALYIFGFVKLLPYFKAEFSEGFYTYILISGFASLFVIALIVLNSIRKESHFLRQLNTN